MGLTDSAAIQSIETLLPCSQLDASGRNLESEQLVRLLLACLAVLLSNDML